MFQWVQDYRSAVDSVLNSPNLNDPISPTPYIEFADVSRIHGGPVLGEQVSALEIAALVFTLQGNRTVESVQQQLTPSIVQTLNHVSFPYGDQCMRHYSFLCCSSTVNQVGAKDTPPYKSKTMNRANDFISRPLSFLLPPTHFIRVDLQN